jgi:hypothetical protein
VNAYATSLLTSHGYVELREESEWPSIPDKGFLTRDGHALLAFDLGTVRDSSVIVCTHSDSPYHPPVFNRFAFAFTAAFDVLRSEIATSAVRFREGRCFSSSSYRDRSEGKVNLNRDFNPMFSLASGRPFKNYIAKKQNRSLMGPIPHCRSEACACRCESRIRHIV